VVGQRDTFLDEVLKYGSLIVDAFVSIRTASFRIHPPFAEIRGGAWVVLERLDQQCLRNKCMLAVLAECLKGTAWQNIARKTLD
jgi:acetyl-CoA carboxylase carboxyltransferase component